ncbi:MAG: endolytic transglycosylase MltG [Bacteroidota bacterium]
MKKLLSLLLLLVVLAGGYFFYLANVENQMPASEETLVLDIPEGSDYGSVMESLAALGVKPARWLFDPLAQRMNFKRENMRSGRFELPERASMIALIRHLRSAGQATVAVVLNNEREPTDVAGKVAKVLAPDSTEFAAVFRDESILSELGLNRQTLQTIFIPNTYELYWDTSPRQFLERMKSEHDKFWEQNDRTNLAASRGLRPAEVYTLASIVEKESLRPEERPRIAGLYLNRLEQGTLLQADPTVVFANRIFDVGRVLYRHLEYDSPYNTYMYPGLPPGPIAMASPGSIDAVLEPEAHDYLFMCAVGDGSGKHNFAETSAGHARNIRVYQENLRSRGIR